MKELRKRFEEQSEWFENAVDYYISKCTKFIDKDKWAIEQTRLCEEYTYKYNQWLEKECQKLRDKLDKIICIGCKKYN